VLARQELAKGILVALVELVRDGELEGATSTVAAMAPLERLTVSIASLCGLSRTSWPDG
jgi:hypothetical protein